MSGKIEAGLSAIAGATFLRQRRLRTRAERLSAATLETLLNAIDANDAETGAHVRRVATYAQILGEAAGFDQHTLRSIQRVALFHDIGKLHEALFDIFHEETKLTPEERRAVRTHPERGEAVLEPLTAFYPDLGIGVRSHHEKWDGTGYPRKLKGKRIPITARVVAIADSFDAITHRRRYSSARSLSEAAKAIAEGHGTQFDPELADLFLSPLVCTDIERAMREAHSPKRKTKVNRRKRDKHPAPDIEFRWRRRTKTKPARNR
ncbi:MAG: HD domain-containing protein [Gemmatimonadaceae bacterium]|nr:HD domain-containing protein [Gemmatimonadaceae bacterium]